VILRVDAGVAQHRRRLGQLRMRHVLLVLLVLLQLGLVAVVVLLGGLLRILDEAALAGVQRLAGSMLVHRGMRASFGDLAALLRAHPPEVRLSIGAGLADPGGAAGHVAAGVTLELHARIVRRAAALTISQHLPADLIPADLVAQGRDVW
jgi:hypothetical protein